MDSRLYVTLQSEVHKLTHNIAINHFLVELKQLTGRCETSTLFASSTDGKDIKASCLIFEACKVKEDKVADSSEKTKLMDRLVKCLNDKSIIDLIDANKKVAELLNALFSFYPEYLGELPYELTCKLKSDFTWAHEILDTQLAAAPREAKEKKAEVKATETKAIAAEHKGALLFSETKDCAANLIQELNARSDVDREKLEYFIQFLELSADYWFEKIPARCTPKMIEILESLLAIEKDYTIRFSSQLLENAITQGENDLRILRENLARQDGIHPLLQTELRNIILGNQRRTSQHLENHNHLKILPEIFSPQSASHEWIVENLAQLIKIADKIIQAFMQRLAVLNSQYKNSIKAFRVVHFTRTQGFILITPYMQMLIECLNILGKMAENTKPFLRRNITDLLLPLINHTLISSAREKIKMDDQHPFLKLEQELMQKIIIVITHTAPDLDDRRLEQVYQAIREEQRRPRMATLELVNHAFVRIAFCSPDDAQTHIMRRAKIIDHLFFIFPMNFQAIADIVPVLNLHQQIALVRKLSSLHPDPENQACQLVVYRQIQNRKDLAEKLDEALPQLTSDTKRIVFSYI